MAERITYALRFRGEAVELGAGRFWAESRAPCCAFGTAVADDGPDGQLELAPGGDAVCRSEFSLHDDGSLIEVGEISFGDVGGITFRASGSLVAEAEPGVRHGAAVWEVTGGHGKLAGVRGLVTSNFLLSDTGDLTDHHLGVLFVEPLT